MGFKGSTLTNEFNATVTECVTEKKLGWTGFLGLVPPDSLPFGHMIQQQESPDWVPYFGTSWPPELCQSVVFSIQ